MGKERFMWRNVLIALAALALLTLGLAIIVYVGLARHRISPTPTPLPEPRPPPLPSGAVSPSETPLPLERVTGLIREYSPGALIIILEPTEGNVEQIIVTENVRIVMADGVRASPMTLTPGQTIAAEGHLDTLGRLVATQIIIVQQRPTPIIPTATPTSNLSPTPVLSIPQEAWRGEYYGNRSLEGEPALVRTDQEINFRWDAGAPAPGLPKDYFSIRWRGRWQLREGGYRFYAYADDGIR